MKSFDVTYTYNDGEKESYRVTANGVEAAMKTADKKFEAKHKKDKIENRGIAIRRVIEDKE